MQRKAVQLISIITWLALAIILLVALLHPIDRQVPIQWLSPTCLLIASSTLVFLLWGLTRWLTRHQGMIFRLTLLTGGLILGLQIWLMLNVVGLGSLDPAAIRLQAAALATGSHHWFTYFSWYPNNVNITLILAGLMTACHATHGIGFGIFLNGWLFAHIDLTIWLLWRLARKYFGALTGLLIVICSFLFVPFYLYGLDFYTDALVLPYILLLATFISNARTATGHKVWWLVATLITFTCAYLIKGNTIVFGIAGLIAWLCFTHLTLRKVGQVLLISVLSLSLLIGGSKLCHHLAEQTGYRQQTALTFPMLSWTLMGLNPASKGTFSQTDINQTSRLGSSTANQKAVQIALRHRIQQLGVTGLIHQLLTKITTMWSTGTQGALFWPDTFQKIPQQYLHHERTVRALLANGTQVVYLNLLITALIGITLSWRQTPFLASLFQLSLLGIFFLHVLFWEVESRYAFLTSPFLIALSANGLRYMAQLTFPQWRLEQKYSHWLVACVVVGLVIANAYIPFHNRFESVPSPTTQLVAQQAIPGYFQARSLTLSPHQQIKTPVQLNHPANQLITNDLEKLGPSISVYLSHGHDRLLTNREEKTSTIRAGQAQLVVKNQTNHSIQIPVINSSIIPLAPDSISGHPHQYLKYVINAEFPQPLYSRTIGLLIYLITLLAILLGGFLWWKTIKSIE
ncbi:glycosyltransferase family 39 protein [Furfurilactobacillus curtus]|uniref:Membrane protein n=1 Tax=Furfurilactobacillus curtus TaxID=1746200 RepID=A0ABQ5JU82_9LACO